MLAKILPRIGRITAAIAQWQNLHIDWGYSSAEGFPLPCSIHHSRVVTTHRWTRNKEGFFPPETRVITDSLYFSIAAGAVLLSGFLDSFFIVIQGQSEVHKPRNINLLCQAALATSVPRTPSAGHTIPAPAGMPGELLLDQSPCAIHPGGAGQLPNTTAGKNPTVGAEGAFQPQWLTLEWSKARRSKCSHPWHYIAQRGGGKPQSTEDGE